MCKIAESSLTLLCNALVFCIVYIVHTSVSLHLHRYLKYNRLGVAVAATVQWGIPNPVILRVVAE